MIRILFESHSTTIDNEAHRSSGWNDIELSELGLKQCHELGERYKNEIVDAVYASDLQRAYKTAEIAFGDRVPIIQDKRLRECDYGDLTQHPSSEVDAEKPKRIHEPFPNGESYEQTAERMKSFLQDLMSTQDGKVVVVIGSRATQYGLERWIRGVSLEASITTPWSYHPGWEYELNTITEEVDPASKAFVTTK